MRYLPIGIVVACGLALPAAAQSPQTAKATFIDAKGATVGTATLTQLAKGVLIDIDASQIPAGEHALHIHAVGRCDPAGGFETAGGHFEPAGHHHGFNDAKGPHAGDMPNQFVREDGRLRAQIFNGNVTLGTGKTSLFDRDGSAIVIHAGTDDYVSQPSGNAGGRIACAVVEKPPAQR